MSRLANFLARIIWFWTLWFVRRPFIRRTQNRSWGWMSEPAQLRAQRSLRRQNRFARKYGLRLIQFTITLLFASMVLSVTAYLAINLYDAGFLSVPDDIRHRMGDG